MAGEVKVDHFYVPGVTVEDLVARICPVTSAYGEICVRFDPHSGQIDVCPFWYGTHIVHGTWHRGEVRTPCELASWMASEEYGDRRSYTVRCLRAESRGVEPGATRQR